MKKEMQNVKVVKKAMSIRKTDKFFAQGGAGRAWSPSSCRCC